METKILYITPPPYRSFLKKDAKLLKKYYKMRVIIFDKLSPPLIFKLFKGVLWADITFSWFADTHAFLAVLLSKLFRKKSIVVVGGYEVANVPEIGYGLLVSPKSARKVKYVLENADRVLTVDESLKKDAINNVGVSGKNIQTVPTGYDINKWKFEGKKEDLVITVGGVKRTNIKIKGFETFVRAAKYLPNIKFALIGPHLDDSIEYLKSIAPSNVEFTGFLPPDKLVKWYQRAKVYCQLSMREGLPNALCEAMLCECVPVGTKHGGIPTAICDTGFYVPYGDPKATAEAIKKALKSDKGKIARERIKSMFPLERRERDLIGIIEEIMGK